MTRTQRLKIGTRKAIFGKPTPDTRFWYWGIYGTLICVSVAILTPNYSGGTIWGSLCVAAFVFWLCNPYQELDE